MAYLEFAQSWTPGKSVGLLLVAGCLLAAGCTEYEEKMDRQQKKLKLADLENDLLGGEVGVPTTRRVYEKDTAKDTINRSEIRIRLPKSVSSKATEEGSFNKYIGNQTGGFQEVIVAAVRTDNSSKRDEMRDWFFKQVIEKLPPLGKPTPQKVGEEFGRARVFDKYKAEGENLYLYVYQSISYTVAIAFRISVNTSTGLGPDKTIEYSLGTLKPDSI